MGPITQSFLTRLVDNIFSSLYQKIENNLLNSNLFQYLNISLPIEDCKKLLNAVFKKAKKFQYFANLSKEELKLLIQDNEELIYSWIICDTQFIPELLSLQNDESKSKHISFLKTIYHLINSEKLNYTNISTERVFQLDKKIYIDTKAILTTVLNIDSKISYTFSPELNEIEELIESRKLQTAQHKLQTIESKILQNNNQEEIEKFYLLQANTYLLDNDKQQESIPYLEKLIIYTKDDFLKLYRKGLLSLISKDYQRVKDIIEQISILELDDKKTSLLINLKFNLLLLNKDWKNLENLCKETTSITGTVVWTIKSYFYQEDYEKAFLAISKLNNSDVIDFNDKILILNVKVFYYLDKISKENFSPDYLKEINSVLPEVEYLLKSSHEDSASFKTLTLLKALIFQYTNNPQNAINEFSKLSIYNDFIDQNYLRNFALVLFSLNRDEESLSYLKKYKSLYPEDTAVNYLYYIVLINLRPEQAITELKQDFCISQFLDIKLLIIDALLKQDRIESAKTELNNFKTSYPENLLVLLKDAKINFISGNLDSAYNIYKRILSVNPEAKVYIEAFQKALQIGLSKRRADYLKETLLFINSEYNYQILLTCGYELGYAHLLLGQLKESHKIIKQCFEYGNKSEDLIRLDMNCYYHSQNYTQCISLYKELKNLNKTNQYDLRIYLYSLMSLGKREELQEAIELLPIPETPREYSYQTKLLIDIGEYSKALLRAESGYLKNKNNQSMMENFIFTVLSHGALQIDDKILRNYNECWNEYSKIPKQQRSVKEYNCNSLDDLLNIINENDEKSEKLDYNKFLNLNSLHISILYSHFNYFFLWKNVKELEQYKIVLSDCSIQNLQKEYKYVKKENLMIDLPSLITCAYLDILPIIAAYFNSILISQKSISILEAAKNSKNNSFSENCTSGLYQLNGYTYENINIQYDDLKLYLERIDSFRECNNVFVVGNQLEPKKELIPEIRDLNKQIDFLEYEDVIYAYSSEMQLLLENFQLRTIIHSFDSNFPCFEIEAILAHLLKEKRVSTEFYFSRIYALLRAHYFCIFFDSHFMFYYLKKNNFDISSEEIVFIKNVLSSNKYISSWCINLLIQLSAQCFANSLPETKLKSCLDLIFQILHNREDINNSTISSFFHSLFQVVSLELHKQIIFEFWENNKDKLNT